MPCCREKWDDPQRSIASRMLGRTEYDGDYDPLDYEPVNDPEDYGRVVTFSWEEILGTWWPE